MILFTCVYEYLPLTDQTGGAANLREIFDNTKAAPL